MSESFRISLELTAAQVSRFNDWLDETCAGTGLDKSLTADIKLCLNEVFANLMNYGLKDYPQPLTIVKLDLEPHKVTATITDNGNYFDIRKWETPRGRDLMAGNPGGFGIALIKERATDVFYTRIGDLNSLVITCERKPR